MSENVDNPEPDPVQTEALEVERPSDSARWLAAISYLFIACLFVIYEAKQRPKDDFVRFHARLKPFLLLAIRPPGPAAHSLLARQKV